MKTADFSYDLPPALIASKPPKVRGEARLLVLDKLTGKLRDDQYSNLTRYLDPGDVIVLNDTSVIPARLLTHKKSSGSERELILLEKHGGDNDWSRHKVLYRRRLAVGDTLVTVDDNELNVETILGEGLAIISSPVDLLKLAEQVGTVPLPPYMHRQATHNDRERYQTVWARSAGSVAAPTASLNMTEALLSDLAAHGVRIVYLTLHVGLGTFLPIRSERLEDHHMHTEYFEIPRATVETIQTAKKSGRRVVAIGTTVTRTLEYAADEILDTAAADMAGEANIFMYPGYRFKLIDGLLTNFHAPRSTVLMLTAAFAGWDKLRAAYVHATNEHYRFLSYGDSMLITELAS